MQECCVQNAEAGRASASPAEAPRPGPLRRDAQRALRVFRRLTLSPAATQPSQAQQPANVADPDYEPPADELALSLPEAEEKRLALPQLCIARRADFLKSDVKGTDVIADLDHP